MSSRQLKRLLVVEELRLKQLERRYRSTADALRLLSQQQDQLGSLQAEYRVEEQQSLTQPLLLKRKRQLWWELERAREALQQQQLAVQARCAEEEKAFLTAYRRREGVAQLARDATMKERKAARRKAEKRGLQDWSQRPRENAEY